MAISHILSDMWFKKLTDVERTGEKKREAFLGARSLWIPPEESVRLGVHLRAHESRLWP